MTTTEAAATTRSRQRVLATLAHREPDRVPIDFGSTAVTGIHVHCIAALRDHYALEKRPVKIHEPYQMLGIIEDDLQQALGLDVEGVFRRKTLFGFPIGDWKPWNFNGLEVLVPGAVRDRRRSQRRHGDLPGGRPRRAAERAHAPRLPLLRHHRPAGAD